MNIHLAVRPAQLCAAAGLALAAAAPAQPSTAAAAPPVQPPQVLSPPLLAPQVLAQALALAAEAAAALAPAGARVQVLPGAWDTRLTLAPCAQVQPYLARGLPAWGRTRVGLRCAAGPTHWNVTMPVTVQVWAPAWVLNASLPAGARLAASQLETAETDWAAVEQPPYATGEPLVGRQLARALAAGQAPRAADLQARQWFAAGETVRIVAAGPGYAVSAEGQAVTPGLEGQAARVRTEGGRVLVGRAVGDRRIEVGP